jgi:hypothetical protein
MHILKSQDFPNLTIAQRRLVLTHLPRHLRLGVVLRQELLRRLLYRDRVVRGVENLEAQSVFLDCQVADLPQVTGVDVRPRVALAARGV